MRRLRRDLPGEAKARASHSLVDAIVSIASKGKDKDHPISTVAVYLASPDEIDLAPAIDALRARGLTVVAPRWNGAAYDLARLTDALRRGPMGILEPAEANLVSPDEVDVWLVPGLAFTKESARLGYGGGWYDRFLAAAKPTALKLGIAYDFQIVESLPTESHDIKLDDVLIAKCEAPGEATSSSLQAKPTNSRQNHAKCDPLTVWIVNPFDNLPTEGLRPQRYWLMSEAFARAGHRVVYWTSDFSHATKEKRKSVGGESRLRTEFDVVQIPTRPYPKNVCWARVRSHRQLARDFGKLARVRLSTTAPDLIISSTPPLSLCDAARRVAKSCGARFVCDIQDAWPETFERLLPRGFKWLGTLLFAPLRRTARRLYREADLVTGVSARYAKLAGRDDFYLAYHGILTAAAEAAAVRGGGTARGRHRLVYIGNLGEGYDLETVLHALTRRTDLTLDIAGLGPKEPTLRAATVRLNLFGRVRFHGYLNDADLQALLAACDVGVVPLRDESWVGIPYKLCDYLKAGLPVVSSLHGECGELLGRTVTGATYDPGDADSFLRSLDALSDRPVSLPPELDAGLIYGRYVQTVSSLKQKQ